jgi:hypothetical protein
MRVTDSIFISGNRVWKPRRTLFSSACAVLMKIIAAQSADTIRMNMGNFLSSGLVIE